MKWEHCPEKVYALSLSFKLSTFSFKLSSPVATKEVNFKVVNLV